MENDVQDDASVRITPCGAVDYPSNATFTEMEEVPSAGYNRLVRAVRYGKWFVLKGLKPEHAADEFYRVMLRKEFEIMVQMEHPNIVRVYSMEEVPALGLCIVMELVDGMPLDEWLAARRPSAHQRRRVLRQLLDAMRHWHSHQAVHRDLKPSNVLVTRNGDNVRVIDFGLADTDGYAILKEPAYTLSYASPEQLQGGPLDCRSDIYSFGRLLRLLFPHRYRLIAARCCRQRRERRYPSAEAVLAAFRRSTAVTIGIALLAVAAALLLCHLAFHYDSRPFAYTVADGQVLRIQIVDSEAVVVGCDTVSGDLALPERVHHGLLRYPLRAIGDRAFYNQRTLRHVTFPDALRRIGDAAFGDCIALTDTIVLTEGLVYIGDHVFDNCESLRACRVQSRRLHIKDNADPHGRFHNTVAMRDVIVDGTVDSLCEGLFSWDYSATTDVWLGEGLTHLGAATFGEMYSLERIHFPSTLRRLDSHCFWGCGLRRLVIPDGIEVVDDYAISMLYQCRYVEVGKDVKYVGINNFYGYRELDTIVFRSPEPPQTTATTFGFDPERPNLVVLVPAASLPLYQSDTTFAKLPLVAY